MSAEKLVRSPKWKFGASWLGKKKLQWPPQRDLKVTLPIEEQKEKPVLLNATGLALRFMDRVLSVLELESAKIALVKLVQAESFKEDLKLLRKGQPVGLKSPLRLLNPFLDDAGVIRVGGRLCLSNEPYAVKHPMVIPGFHRFTRLILTFYHLVWCGVTDCGVMGALH